MPVPLKHRHGDYDRFVSEWSIVFAQAEMIDEYSDQGGANWESFVCRLGYCQKA